MCVVVTKLRITKKEATVVIKNTETRTYCISQTYGSEDYYYESKFKSLCHWT